MNVLVVEKSRDAWIALQIFLSSRGDRPFWASRAIQAIRMLMHERIDVVLLDVELGPGELSGLDVVRAMIDDERLIKIPRVLMSSLSAEQIRERAKTPVVDLLRYVSPVILAKPLELDEVEHEMMRAVARGAPR